MKTAPACSWIAAGVLFLFSCARNSELDEKQAVEKAKEDSIQVIPSSSAAVESGRDTVRKFIRTAGMKFRVKNVIASTYRIEDLVSGAGGYVSYTNLSSSIDYKTITPVSADSSLETLHYTVSDEMSLRVPNTALDSVLKAMAGFVDYLDYRVIRANDVRLQMLTNRLSRARMERQAERLEKAIDTKGRKLGETASAEDALFRKEERADEATVSNLSLQDQVDYSTVSITIYQRQGVKRTVIANDRNIDAYEPGIGTRLLDALKLGWRIIEKLIVLLADCWPFVLIAVIGLTVYRKYADRLKKKS